MYIYYLVAALCGIAIGLTEILTRYKDDPLKVIGCAWSLVYMIFNGALSAIAFYILVATGTAAEDATTFHNLQYAVYAGFGAVVIMRAKLINLKLNEGEQVSIGPDFVINALLKALDREIDRYRAYRRAGLIIRHMTGYSYSKIKMPVITMTINAMQNLTDDEVKDLGRDIAKNDAANELSDQDRSFALGFMVLNLVGEKFFSAVISPLVKKLSAPPRSSSQ